MTLFSCSMELLFPASGWRWQWQWMAGVLARTWLLFYLIHWHWPNGYQENDTLLCTFPTLHVNRIKMISPNDFHIVPTEKPENDDAVCCMLCLLNSFWPQRNSPLRRAPRWPASHRRVAFGLTSGCTRIFLVSRLFHSDLTTIPFIDCFFSAIVLSNLLSPTSLCRSLAVLHCLTPRLAPCLNYTPRLPRPRAI